MAPRSEPLGWLWFTSRADEGLKLDRSAYPLLKHITFQPVKTEWTCVQPNLIVHTDARVGRIDARVQPLPRMGRFQIGWMERGIQILRRDWADSIAHFVDGERIAFGDIIVDDVIVPDWVTIHAANTLALLSDDCQLAICPRCGGQSSTNWGEVCFFAEEAVAEAPLIVNRNGIFVREDEIERHGIRQPFGAYRASKVTFSPGLGAKLWPPLNPNKAGVSRRMRLRETPAPRFDPFAWLRRS